MYACMYIYIYAFTFDLTHMMSMVDIMAIIIETPTIESGYFLEKEFTKLIHMNS